MSLTAVLLCMVYKVNIGSRHIPVLFLKNAPKTALFPIIFSVLGSFKDAEKMAGIIEAGEGSILLRGEFCAL